MSYNEIVYNLLAFFVLCPSLIILAVGSKSDYFETDRQIRETLLKDCRREEQRLETWVENRKSAIINLAEMAALKSPQQMQSYLEQAKKRQASSAAPLSVTASFGVVQLQNGDDEDGLIRRVDDALYRAKHEGRNKVIIS